MSRAARRRQNRSRQILAAISYRDPERFDAEWEKRLDSWLIEIRHRAEEWKQGKTEGWRLVHEVPQLALAVLSQCSPAAQRKHRESTWVVLEDACIAAVAGVIGRKLCRTNSISPEWLMYMARGPEAKDGEWAE